MNPPVDAIVNLENCAREPIHIPGAIQPHGVLLVLSEPDLAVLQISENAEAILGTSASNILTLGLSTLLNPAQIERLRFALESSDPNEINPVPLDLKTADGIHLDAIVHRHDGFSFLELD